MLLYLLKSGACLGVLLLFYKLFLEKENMHVFKRYYLLGALSLALLIPILVFIEYIEVPAPNYTAIQAPIATDEISHVHTELEQDIWDLAPILWSIYVLGLLFFGIKFIKNLFQIFKRIRKNPKNKLPQFTQVLLLEKIPPHTFFSYIFLNKKKLEANEIPEEVLLHEETHAQQKHSLDVVFVEFLQVLFWCNPFIYFTKKAIKLNHEFLADDAVLQKDVDQSTYQNTLLSYLSNESANKYQSLANAINHSSYSSIKKRFTVMKKFTSRKSVLLRSILLLPLLAVLIYSFSETKIETIVTDSVDELTTEIETIEASNRPTKQNLVAWQNSAKYAIWIDGSHVQNRVLENYKPSDFGNYFLSYVYDNARSAKFPQPYQLALYSIEAFEREQELLQSVIRIHVNREGQLLIKGEVILLEKADDYIAALIKERNILKAEIISNKLSPLDVVKEVNAILDKHKIAHIDIRGSKEMLSQTSEQNGATKEQLSEYNTLAKKYNSMLTKNSGVQIKMKDVNRLEYLYGLMSTTQKANAEAFPDFPEPPPMPKAPEAPKVKNGEKSSIPPPPLAPNTPDNSYLNEEALEEIIENQEIIANEQGFNYRRSRPIEAPKELHSDKIFFGGDGYIGVIDNPKIRFDDTVKIYNNGKEISQHEMMRLEKAGQIISMNISKKPGQEDRIDLISNAKQLDLPPLPPEPKSPMDFIIDMAKKDALFYFEDKEISSDKAIELLKKNKDINIDARNSNGTTPIVRLSKKPIRIEN